MPNSFDELARKILMTAKEEMNNLKHPYVGSEHLLLAILKNKNEISNKLKKYELTYQKFKEEIINIIGEGKKKTDCFLYTPLLKRILETSMMDSRENNKGVVTINHLFSALLEEGEGVAIRIMLGMNIDLDFLYKEFSNKIVNYKKNKNQNLFIDEIGIDLTKKALEEDIDPVIGRDEEIKRIIEILCRRKKNNPILIGEAGVGKTAIVEELARLISLGEVPLLLKNKRIISIDMSSAVAGTKYRGEFEDRINNILKEIEENDNIILFIDEVHTLVGAGGAEGAIDASNIFKPALARNKIRLIGATTISEYKKFIENDKALDRRFQKVNIEIPNKDIVINILKKLKPKYEEYHHVKLENNMIELIVELSDKYIYNRFQPDKAIDILDEVCAHVNLKENKQIKKYNQFNQQLHETIKLKNKAIYDNDFDRATNLKTEENRLMNMINRLELDLCKNNRQKNISTKDIIDIVSRKANIPIYSVNTKLSDILKIEKMLSKNIIGQEKAIKELLKIYKKLKLGYTDNKCYSIMFQGPSGVGKTELAKLFGKYLTNYLIKLDMSEYSESHSISKLIGSPAGYVGYEEGSFVLEKIKNNPFSILILDEIERAHPNVLNLFLSILDDGKIKDSKGNIIYFNNVIIIMTSNVGFEKSNIGFTTKSTSKLKEEFSIPFLNRIDSIVTFDYLKKDNIIKIIKNKLNLVKKKYKNQKIVISNNVINEIIDESNYLEYGARKIDKIIKNKIENAIIDNIICNKKSINIRKITDEKIYI